MPSDERAGIIDCRDARIEEWERMCDTCHYATFFHTPLFAGFFTQVSESRMTAASKRIEFRDGAVAILPLVRKRHLGNLVRLHWSMPANTFGGWVSADPLTAAHARELVLYLQGIPDLVWRENPYDSLCAGLDLCHAAHDFTQAIDLRGGFDGAAARFDHAHRKAVKKARSAGVTIAEASNFDQWRQYISLYEASLKRWKERKLLRHRGFDPVLLRRIFESPEQHRKLWLASINETPVAGILCFYWNRHAVAWLGAGAADFFHCRPNNLLYEHAIGHAAETGHHWFDCNPSGGFSGVIEFKEHLGAIRLRSRVVNKRSILRRAAESARNIANEIQR